MKIAVLVLFLAMLFAGCQRNSGNTVESARQSATSSASQTVPPSSPAPSSSSSAAQNVSMIPQQQSNWCWAASAEMILAALGNDVPQCRQASDRIMKKDNVATQCCNGQNSGQCNITGWPDFQAYGFTPQTTTDGYPQKMQDIEKELEAGEPFAFSWSFHDGGGHMMVATQIVQGDQGPEIMVNDPEGDTVTMTYDAYNAGNDYDHWRDYYDIVKQ